MADNMADTKAGNAQGLLRRSFGMVSWIFQKELPSQKLQRRNPFGKKREILRAAHILVRLRESRA